MRHTLAVLVAGLVAAGVAQAQAPKAPAAAPAKAPAPAAAPAAAPAPGAPGGTLVGAPAGPGRELLQKHNCTTACHALERKVVGPAYYDVAAFYKGTAAAMAPKLAAKVKAGGTGVWDKVIPMAPNPLVPDADMKVMIDYILALKAPAGYKVGQVPVAAPAAAPAAPAAPAKK
jgi:cytochrome c